MNAGPFAIKREYESALPDLQGKGTILTKAGPFVRIRLSPRLPDDLAPTGKDILGPTHDVGH